MSISSHLSPWFSEGVRQRGQAYFTAGYVRILHGSPTEFEGRVRGTEPHEVMIEVTGNELRLSCDCSFFDTEGPCRHLWAGVLAAEKLRYLSAAARATRLAPGPGQGAVAELAEDEPDTDSALTPVSSGLPWRARLRELLDGASGHPAVAASPSTPAEAWRWPHGREILYVLNRNGASSGGALQLGLHFRDRRADGEWGRLVPLTLRRSDISRLPDQTDHNILAAVSGALSGTMMSSSYSWASQNPVPSLSTIDAPLARIIIPVAAKQGRLLLREAQGPQDAVPVVWNENQWNFALEIEAAGPNWRLQGMLSREGSRISVADAELISTAAPSGDGFVFSRLPVSKDGAVRIEVAPLDAEASLDWINHFRSGQVLDVPDPERDEFLASLLSAPHLPRIKVPVELQFEEISPTPRPTLRISSSADDPRNLRGILAFDYEGHSLLQQAEGSGVYDSSARRFIRRDMVAERDAGTRLAALGGRYQSWYNDIHWLLPATKLPRIIRALVNDKWHVETDGKSFRPAGDVRVEVTSGVDWFDLWGQVDYGGATAGLPELLEAMRRGETVVRLSDGGFGLLPDSWLKRFGLIAGLGEAVEDKMRFGFAQAGILDALLAAQPEATCDETFTRMRVELRNFSGVEAAVQPEGFVGQLRDYQREGLGWMSFLRRFGFGGCLADDMGVGKTPQVLALLEDRRALREANPDGVTVAGPSLVVVPKSLVFNWQAEAARFTPRLKVLDYTGAARTDLPLAGFDVVITTYGTLRRDAPKLKDIQFDYIVLDEAQAVKNSGSESAKAVRLLKGRHRLVLSGTPVENHLGELWSLFEFLNPGMLGSANVFRLTSSSMRNPDEENRALLAHALRPFILRRTKGQVARELPERTEQTLRCELEPTERRLYNELRQHFRDTLLGRIEREGIGKSGIHVLEALLRLRQAACHPGLIDKTKTEEPSSKIDLLMDHLTPIVEEGHKALVFSQFTSLLDIVRKRLDAQGIVYEYLDGKTNNRQDHVERFQNDPKCPIFLISLKAGGVGLNLTAAGYVFLLDPWWNPAVEAQAIDRTHRIGQTRQVFAYRLIATDTVEEKVLELQKSKRDLVDSIITADNSLIRNLQKEDLEMLLS
jgi:superfamily II DNA or RNA helicase